MEGFYRKKGGARKLLAKEKDCSRHAPFPLRIKTRGLTQITFCVEGPFTHQKIPHYSVKTTFLGKFESAVNVGVKP